MVNEYQFSDWVIIINGDGGCRRLQPTSELTAQVRWLGLRIGGRLPLFQMNRVNSRNDLMVMMIALNIVLGIIIPRPPRRGIKRWCCILIKICICISAQGSYCKNFQMWAGTSELFGNCYKLKTLVQLSRKRETIKCAYWSDQEYILTPLYTQDRIYGRELRDHTHTHTHTHMFVY